MSSMCLGRQEVVQLEIASGSKTEWEYDTCSTIWKQPISGTSSTDADLTHGTLIDRCDKTDLPPGQWQEEGTVYYYCKVQYERW